MYEVGEKVIYGTQGICEIEDISSGDLGDDDRKYYILCPLSDPRSKIYVPCDNEKLLGKIRKILSPSEIDTVIGTVEPDGMEWIANDNQRKEFCSGILRDGDRKKLMEMVEMLNRRQNELKSQKKHFHLTDERFLKEAEKILSEEFSFSLGIPQSAVSDYIISRLKDA